MTRQVSLLDLTGIYILAVAFPIFDFLSRYDQFFISRQLTPQKLWLIMLAWLLAPMLVYGVLQIIKKINVRLAEVLMQVCMIFLMALLMLMLLKSLLVFLPGLLIVLLSLFLGAVLAVSSSRFSSFKGFLNVFALLSCAYLAFLVLAGPLAPLFFSGPPETPLTPVRIGKPAPVIMLVFDELPISQLMNEAGKIDAINFPHFAMLSRSSTWYQHTLTTADATMLAVPSIISGLLPSPNRLPNAKSHPHSLFTLLGANYKVYAIESRTDICPSLLCQKKQSFEQLFGTLSGTVQDMGYVYLHLLLPTDLKEGLPDITHDWVNFGENTKAPMEVEEKETLAKQARLNALREKGVVNNDRDALFDEFLTNIGHHTQKEKSPPLHFLHIVLPHSPYNYLPSGKYYSRERGLAGMRPKTHVWEDPRGMIQTYQRYRLQVRYADTLLGRLLDRLKSAGLYNKALIVVVADHGVSFRMGEDFRLVDRGKQNYREIMYVPLFIKEPFQRKERVETQTAQIVDVLPTIADILKMDMPWKTDGHSLLAPHNDMLHGQHPICNQQWECISFPFDPQDIRQAVQDRVALFGSTQDPLNIFRVGPNRTLFGTRLHDYGVKPIPTEFRYKLDHPERFQNVSLKSDFIPALVEGKLSSPEGSRAPVPTELVLSINDVIWGIQPYTQSKQSKNSRSVVFSFFVPEVAYSAGDNKIRLFALQRNAGRVSFLEIPRKESKR